MTFFQTAQSFRNINQKVASIDHRYNFSGFQKIFQNSRTLPDSCAEHLVAGLKLYLRPADEPY